MINFRVFIVLCIKCKNPRKFILKYSKDKSRMVGYHFDILGKTDESAVVQKGIWSFQLILLRIWIFPIRTRWFIYRSLNFELKQLKPDLSNCLSFCYTILRIMILIICSYSWGKIRTWYLYQKVTQHVGAIPVIWSVSGIWLDRDQSQKEFFLRKKNYFSSIFCNIF